MLERYPHRDNATSLIYQLALTRAEAGQFDQALALFKDVFFKARKAESTQQVLFEIKLMQAEAKAERTCTATKEFS